MLRQFAVSKKGCKLCLQLLLTFGCLQVMALEQHVATRKLIFFLSFFLRNLFNLPRFDGYSIPFLASLFVTSAITFRKRKKNIFLCSTYREEWRTSFDGRARREGRHRAGVMTADDITQQQLLAC